MEIYKNNLEYAKKNGEREQYLQNLELCDKCGAFIRHSIAVNFNFTTKYLDVKTITAEVTEKYGFERTMLMLALRVDSLKNDGRVDIANKEWAKKILVNYPNAEELRKIADRVFENAHPALLDSVAEEVRFTFMEMNRSKEREVESYRIIQTVKTPYAEFLLGQNKNMPSYYATWYNGKPRKETFLPSMRLQIFTAEMCVRAMLMNPIVKPWTNSCRLNREPGKKHMFTIG